MLHGLRSPATTPLLFIPAADGLGLFQADVRDAGDVPQHYAGELSVAGILSTPQP
jgi:hypothetical protein